MHHALSIAVVIAVLPSLVAAQEPQHRLQGRAAEPKTAGLQTSGLQTSGLMVAEPDAQDRELRTTPVVRAVQKAADSVVSIYINHDGVLRGRSLTEGQGSGVILDETGFVITNWHVIATTLGRNDYSVEIRLKDGRARPARVLSSSASHDLALLKMQLENGERVKPVEIGHSNDLMIGETLLAIGNPQGHANTVTQGVLSAIGRSIQAVGPDNNRRDYTGLLQTDAAINPGNSGGALLDITGKLVGINNAMAMGAENIGFAIPVDTVREVFEKELLASDGFGSIWLGMELGEADGTLVVKNVVPGGPAAQAGVREGDAVLAAGEAPVRTMLDYTRSVLTLPAGKPFALRLRRDGVEVKAAPQPIPRTAGDVLALTGIDVEEVDDDSDALKRASRAFFGARRGAQLPSVLRVRGVLPGSPAAELGLQQNDLLLATPLSDGFRMRDYRIDSTRTFADLLHRVEGNSLKLVVLRGEDEMQGTLDVRRRTAR